MADSRRNNKPMENDKDEIMAIHKTWIDAERRGDVDAMLSLCSSDIRLFAAELSTKQGKHAVREFLQTSVGSIQNINISNIEIEISGSLAYKTASFLTESQEFPELKVQGSHLWILRREEFGWRILIVTWATW
jgi:ketosteroid isomerase-like protein